MSQRITAATAAAAGDELAVDDAIREAVRWLDWIRDRADHHDPTTELATWPKPPQLAAYQLKEFMNHVAEPEDMRYQPDTY